MKYATLYGLIFGFMLAVGALWQGLLGFLVVLVLAGIGGLLGAHLEGRIDLGNLLNVNLRGSGRS
ncbi:MAG TPA: hypothetical protein H9867_08350 [Candidatus Corynebacterium gallistercoris]|uniref:DUF2273 domain-containing protein n=1 Tax=Candidatus Corynebacterium gallistercoris TaxID=2838530 RepID=A0A9D1RZM9_9CORY|nr:hypothetical protein [Candidatus Corynebacterium gallistercoris]